jgi:hypothetical protein
MSDAVFLSEQQSELDRIVSQFHPWSARKTSHRIEEGPSGTRFAAILTRQ